MSFPDIFKVLVPVMIGGLLTVTGQLVVQWFSRRTRREEELYRRLVDQAFELEDLAGDLAETVTSHRNLDPIREQLADQFDSLNRKAGQFRRYPDLLQAIRELHHSAALLVVDRKGFASVDEFQTARQQVNDDHQAILKACDRILGRKS